MILTFWQFFEKYTITTWDWRERNSKDAATENWIVGAALKWTELRMLALLWGLGFNKFTGNFTKYLPGKISRECWKSYLDILTEIYISVFCFKQGLWKHSLQIELVNTDSFSAHILGTDSFERSCEKPMMMNNDLQPDTINNMVSGKLWNWISLEIDVSPKYRLGTVAIQCLANICFPPPEYLTLTLTHSIKCFELFFQENLFHSREWLGERGGSRGNPCEVRFSKLPELPNPTLKSLRHIHH